MILNYSVGEDSRESFGLQGDQAIQSYRKSVLNIHWKTDAGAETLTLWPPDEKNWLIRKDLDAGEDWRQEEKGSTEDELVGWHHWLNGHEFKQASELVMDMEAWHAAIYGVTKSQTRLNWTELISVLKDGAVKALHSICQQIWITQQWPQDWQRLVFISVPKKGNAKECTNHQTMLHISHASQLMLKTLQARLQ